MTLRIIAIAQNADHTIELARDVIGYEDAEDLLEALRGDAAEAATQIGTRFDAHELTIDHVEIYDDEGHTETHSLAELGLKNLDELVHLANTGEMPKPEEPKPSKAPKCKIKYKCGCEAMEEIPAGTKKEVFKATQANRLCKPCWKAEAAERNASELESARETAAGLNLPQLKGKSEASISWAEIERAKKATSLIAFLQMAGPADMPRLPGLTGGTEETKRWVKRAIADLLRDPRATNWLVIRKHTVKQIVADKVAMLLIRAGQDPVARSNGPKVFTADDLAGILPKGNHAAH